MLFLGGSDATTLEYVSKKLGKETIRSVNNSRSYGKQGSHSLSYNKTGRELMTPDELSNMDNQNCILFIRGLYPFFSTKYPLEAHPNFPRSGDGNDKYLYDVKKRLRTGANRPRPAFNAGKAAQIYTDAQVSDTREADRQMKRYMRKVESFSAKNQPLGKRMPVAEAYPGIAKSPEERTAEEQANLEAVFRNLEISDINNLSDEEFMAHQLSIHREAFEPHPFGFYGASEISSDEERAEN